MISNEILVGFSNLPPDLPIYSPIEGELVVPIQKGENFINPDALGVMIFTSTDIGKSLPNVSIMGDVQYVGNNSRIKKGDVVAYTTNTGVNMLGKYTFLVGFFRYDKEKGVWVDDVDMIKSFFPNLSSQLENTP